MATTSSFSFSNTTENAALTITPIDLKLKTNYSLISDDAGVCFLENKTAPLDQGESVSIKASEVKNVLRSMSNLHPAPVQSAVQYSISIEELLSTTDASDPSFRIDDPIRMTLTIAHNKTSNITDATIAQVLLRLLGTLVRSDGTYRFNDLMRKAVSPQED